MQVGGAVSRHFVFRVTDFVDVGKQHDNVMGVMFTFIPRFHPTIAMRATQKTKHLETVPPTCTDTL